MKKSMITKILALTLALSACAGGMSVYAQGGEAETSAVIDTDIQPKYTAIVTTSSGLKHMGSGKMNCQGTTTVRDGYNAGVTVELQQNTSSGWTTIQSWSDSDSDWAIIEQNYYVPKGYSYRVKTTHRSYTSSWSLIESVTKYSNIASY